MSVALLVTVGSFSGVPNMLPQFGWIAVWHDVGVALLLELFPSSLHVGVPPTHLDSIFVEDMLGVAVRTW